MATFTSSRLYGCEWPARRYSSTAHSAVGLRLQKRTRMLTHTCCGQDAHALRTLQLVEALRNDEGECGVAMPRSECQTSIGLKILCTMTFQTCN